MIIRKTWLTSWHRGYERKEFCNVPLKFSKVLLKFFEYL